MTPDYLDYVEDILDAMEKAEIILEGIRYEDYETDFRINFAVIRALEIISEASKRIPEDLRESTPNIPWKGMSGMRDRIIHGYDNIDYQIIWDVVKKDIPKIKPLIQKNLKDY